MNTLQKGTIVQIISKSSIRYAHDTKIPIQILNTLQLIDRTTKDGWYLIQLNEYSCPTITIPKKHLKVFKPYLSSHGLTAKEIQLFRVLRLLLKGVHTYAALSSVSCIDKPHNYQFVFTGTIEEVISMLNKLGVIATTASYLKDIKNKLQPFLDYYICE